MGAFESGQEFLAGVFAKLPVEIRAQVEEAFKKPEAKDAVVLLGDGTLARSDYSKQMDALSKQQAELEDLREQHTVWFNENHAALQEYVKIKPEFEQLKSKGGTPNPNPNPNPSTGLDESKVGELLNNRLDETSRSFAGAMALALNLVQEHNRMFNEKLDIMEMLADPRLGRPVAGQPGRVIGLQDIYEAKHGERVVQYRKTNEEKRFNDEVEKRLAEERKKHPVPQPFPLRDSSPSPLDALTAADRKPGDYSVDTATAEYERLSQIRAGQTA